MNLTKKNRCNQESGYHEKYINTYISATEITNPGVKKKNR